eukprot:2270233-Pyramimonas_sp.AAC.1
MPGDARLASIRRRPNLKGPERARSEGSRKINEHRGGDGQLLRIEGYAGRGDQRRARRPATGEPREDRGHQGDSH